MSQSGRAVVTGSMHVFTEADGLFLRAVRRPVVGVPLTEVFPEPEYAPFLELYDWAARHHQPVAFVVTAPNGETGTVTLCPADHGLRVDWSPVVVHQPSHVVDRAMAD